MGPSTNATDRGQAGLAAASQRSGIASFIVMDVMRAAAAAEAAGRHIIHMEVGQPATPAPQSALDAVAHALRRDTLGYTLALGLDPLRKRIARMYGDWYGLDVAPSRVIVTAGSSAGFVLAFLSLFDAGDAVGLPAPGYPCYRHILTALGCRPANLETGPSDRWMPTAAALLRAIDERGLKGVLLASPSNPTGTMLEPDRLAQIAEVCKARGIWFISDEIYHGLTYGQPAVSALGASGDVVVINSFSKYFSMTGWRVGWMVVPERMVRTVERLTQNLYISPPAVSQVAALGAFDGLGELEANRAVYAANRELLLKELPAAGFKSIVPADGAFYLYCDVSDRTSDSLGFTRRMLDEAGVAATPGLDFDEARGGHFVRFSYAGSTADMAEAARRLKVWAQAGGPILG